MERCEGIFVAHGPTDDAGAVEVSCDGLVGTHEHHIALCGFIHKLGGTAQGYFLGAVEPHRVAEFYKLLRMRVMAKAQVVDIGTLHLLKVLNPHFLGLRTSNGRVFVMIVDTTQRHLLTIDAQHRCAVFRGLYLTQADTVAPLHKRGRLPFLPVVLQAGFRKEKSNIEAIEIRRFSIPQLRVCHPQRQVGLPAGRHMGRDGLGCFCHDISLGVCQGSTQLIRSAGRGIVARPELFLHVADKDAGCQHCLAVVVAEGL